MKRRHTGIIRLIQPLHQRAVLCPLVNLDVSFVGDCYVKRSPRHLRGVPSNNEDLNSQRFTRTFSKTNRIQTAASFQRLPPSPECLGRSFSPVIAGLVAGVGMNYYETQKRFWNSNLFFNGLVGLKFCDWREYN
jgi:hypothetical protein